MFRPSPDLELFVDTACKLAADECGVPKWSLWSPGKTRAVATARALWIQAMRHLTSASYPQLAIVLNQKYPTLVLASKKQMPEQVESLAAQLRELFPVLPQWPKPGTGKRGPNKPKVAPKCGACGRGMHRSRNGGYRCECVQVKQKKPVAIGQPLCGVCRSPMRNLRSGWTCVECVPAGVILSLGRGVREGGS